MSGSAIPDFWKKTVLKARRVGKALRLAGIYLDDGAPNSALRVMERAIEREKKRDRRDAKKAGDVYTQLGLKG